MPARQRDVLRLSPGDAKTNPPPVSRRGVFTAAARPVEGTPTELYPLWRLRFHRCRHIHEGRDLVEVHVTVDVSGLGVDHLDVFHVLGHGRDLAQQGAD